METGPAARVRTVANHVVYYKMDLVIWFYKDQAQPQWSPVLYAESSD